ncbi:MAG: YhcH/YjgK/YiaL family protein [Clostridia bacterium]|nr:YhcH/YjgK/YiaL family protein [Clostridia bacterium]
MIKLTNLQDLQKYFPSVTDEAIAFLKALSESTENGKYPFGPDVTVNVQSVQTKTDETAMMEAHDVFVDFQYMVSGEEKIIFTPKANLKIGKEYDEVKDRAFYVWEEGESVTYQSGEGVVLYPEEAHLPGLAVKESKLVKKAVVKIRY